MKNIILFFAVLFVAWLATLINPILGIIVGVAGMVVFVHRKDVI